MISNSTPIICLAKIGRLSLLREIFGIITVTDAVRQEILIEGKPGYAAISEAFGSGLLKMRNPKGSLNLGLGKGEESAIILARETGDSILLDDAFAIKVARAFGMTYFRSTGIIMLAASKKIITRKQAVSLITDLVSAGYYISPAHLAALLTRMNY